MFLKVRQDVLISWTLRFLEYFQTSTSKKTPAVQFTRNVSIVDEKDEHLKPVLLRFGAVEFPANLQLQMSGVKLSPFPF